jgi:hypothetical protein
MVDINNIYTELKEIKEKMAGLIEINQTLVQQNLKLSEELYGKIKVPEPLDSKHDLYYCNFGPDHVLIHGPGTYDNRDRIKQFNNAEWNKELKAWKIKATEDDITKTFNSITIKELVNLQ